MEVLGLMGIVNGYSFQIENGRFFARVKDPGSDLISHKVEILPMTDDRSLVAAEDLMVDLSDGKGPKGFKLNIIDSHYNKYRNVTNYIAILLPERYEEIDAPRSFSLRLEKPEHSRVPPSYQDRDLTNEKLSAQFVEYKMFGHPIVSIRDPKTGIRHLANLIYSTNEKIGDESNKIREELMRNRAGDIRVKVIGRTFLSRFGENYPEYEVIALPSRNNDSKDTRRNEFEITPEEALAVLRSDDIFYTRCVSKSRNQKSINEWRDAFPHKSEDWILENIKADASVVVYTANGKRGFGFVKPVDGRGLRKDWAANIITNEMLYGSDKIKAVQPGDYMTVRKIAQNPSSSTWFFEPVINFGEYDRAISPEGESLVTKVEGYERGAEISNLPIITLNNRPDTNEIRGQGYVKRPENESKSFYFKPVVVIGAEEDLGSFVRRAEILKNGDSVILAKKID